MLKSYFKIALRNLLRQKGYSVINIAGLTVGLACSFFILLWVMDESSYDRFHEDGDRLYRVMRNADLGGQKYTWASIPKPVSGVLEADYPEVTDAVMLTWQEQPLVSLGDQSFREAAHYADSAFFEIFTFPFVLGDPGTVIDEPNAVAISEELAGKFFGPDWQAQGEVLGKTLTIDRRKDFIIRGVFEDVPDNSTLQFDLVMPTADWYERNEWVEHWGNSGMQLFVRLQDGASHTAVSEKIANVTEEHHEGANAHIFLQPYTDIRLHSNYRDWELVGGRILFVRIFSVAALFLLLIASINFMNLATARSMQRAREIGVRKVVGANRHSLMLQFIGESLVIAGLAFVLALGLVLALLPVFNDLTEKSIAYGDLSLTYLLGFLGIALVTGLLSGSYPAFYLSSFNPITVLRGTLRQRPITANLRQGLVIFQFTLSILLIVVTIAVYSQVEYIRTKDLGLDRDNLVYTGWEGGIREQYDAFKQELLQRPGIALVTTSSQNPLNVGNSTTDPEWDGKAEDDNTLFHVINAHYDFVEAMKMELVAGRAFSEDFALDSANFVINERAAAAMGMDDPVGQRLAMWEREGQIIGVVRDFHFSSFYEAIEPAIIRLGTDDTGELFVRTQPGQTDEALASLETLYEQFNPGYPFDYEFLDQVYEDAYRSEITMGTLANLFAGIATFISCLGLFGLASFTAERRTKEIGIRKVMGASVANLVMLLSMNFTRLVLAAFIIAVPLGYWAINEWLSSFIYRVDIGYGIFAVSGIAALLIAWLTVAYQSIKAATANPVKSLRYE